MLCLIFFFLWGTLMGSFYTVIGMRLPMKENFLTGRSCCDHCKHTLVLWDMIPIFSYLVTRGKCRYCKHKVDILYPIMEFFTGILFALAYYCFHSSYESYELIIALGIVSLLMIVVVSDITYLIIPDEVLIFFSLYFLFFQFLKEGANSCLMHILTGIFLFVIMYLIMIIGNKILHRESLGGGDIKMMFLFGLILDPLLGTISIFLGSLIALPISLLLLLKNHERVIPFGPFLMIALTFLYFSSITPNMIISFLGF